MDGWVKRGGKERRRKPWIILGILLVVLGNSGNETVPAPAVPVSEE